MGKNELRRSRAIERCETWVKLLERGFTITEIAAHWRISPQAVDASLRHYGYPAGIIEAVRAKTAEDHGGAPSIKRAAEEEGATASKAG